MNFVKRNIYYYVVPLIGRVFQCRNRFCNVIYYHDIVEGDGDSFMKINVELFKRQMLYLKEKGIETLTFQDLESDPCLLSYSPRRVLITFDDGWRSNLTMIYDWMREQGLKYNIFLTIGEIENNPAYLDWNQVRYMAQSGNVGFGVHTLTHPDLSFFDKIDTEKEFSDANRLFEKELHYKPLDFCYPYGKYGDASDAFLRNYSYKRIFKSDLDYSRVRNGKIFFGRNAISADEPFSVFIRKVKGYYNIFQSLKRK